MAEALVNHSLPDSWQAFSAGTEPSLVNPRVIAVMSEIGIDVGSSRSTSVEEFLNRDDLDLILTVCDSAKESCPVFPGPIEHVHLSFEDPSAFTDYPDDLALKKFREVRDSIASRLIEYLRSQS